VEEGEEHMTGHPVINYYLARALVEDRNREADATRKARSRFSNRRGRE